MSPIKRALSDRYGEGASPKRLRGGGFDAGADDDDDNGPRTFAARGAGDDDDDLYDDDLVDAAWAPGDDIPGEEALEEVKAKIPAKDQQRWKRPDLPDSLSNAVDLNMQWIDMDVVVAAKPLETNPNAARRTCVGSREGQVPILRCYGVDEGGHSVAAFFHGFTPYAYFALPSHAAPLVDADAVMAAIRISIDARLRESARGVSPGSSLVMGVHLVKDHKSIFGYETPHTQFLKVFVALPGLIAPLKRVMEEGIKLAPISSSQESYAPFECNVPIVLRFMVDRGITGAGWLTFPASAYTIRSTSNKETHCQVRWCCTLFSLCAFRQFVNPLFYYIIQHYFQIEVDISYDDILPRKSEGEWNKVASLRILSVDIECQGRKGHFPEAEQDPVIQIANTVTVYGQDNPIVQNVFTLKGCLPIVGAQVITSDEEEDMLTKWSAFLRASDPDIITGYNVQNFDIPYLLDRAEVLAKKNSANKTALSGFAQWGRIRNAKAKMKDTMFQSAAYGRRANVETTIEGRVIFDMFPYMTRNHKLSSYTLNSVCAEYLGQQKEDVHHSIIADLQNGSDEDRHRLAVYCLKDAQLPQRLMDKLSVLVNYVEMARVTGVPMSYLISRGQQIKVFSMILRKCQDEKLLVPTLRKSGNPNGSDIGYEGATVLDPIKSYYQDPIATLDFASLYPSIMQAYNLCYSTLVNPSDVAKLDPALYKKSENGNVFVHSTVKKGILPTILEEILTARKRAKKDMKSAPTEFERAVQNGRQLALKVSANSVYGFTGATVGQLPCVPIASSVTSYGRLLLEKTKEYVEANYTKANGYEHDAVVIYGDTDSVMVKFGTKTVAETFPLAIEAAEKCSKIFPSPIQLEFEKVYFPYLLM